MPIKAVLDTNVWVSYFISARAEYLVVWLLDHDVNVYTCDELIDEIEDVLKRPKFKTPINITEFINLHINISEKIKIKNKFTDAPDQDDNFLFDLCIESGAEYLITSDKKLLSYKPPFNLKIISFTEWRRQQGS